MKKIGFFTLILANLIISTPVLAANPYDTAPTDAGITQTPIKEIVPKIQQTTTYVRPNFYAGLRSLLSINSYMFWLLLIILFLLFFVFRRRRDDDEDKKKVKA